MLSESSAPSTARRSSLSMTSDKIRNDANSARGERGGNIDKSFFLLIKINYKILQ